MNTTRYPGYDVQDKRDSLSWDELTRQVVKQRLAASSAPRHLEEVAWKTLLAACARIVPRCERRELVLIAAMLDARLHANAGDGYRDARLPSFREAWHIGLSALEEESSAAHGMAYPALDERQQNELLKKMQHGELRHPAWQHMPADLFFNHRLLKDICGAYYSLPQAWSEIGFGGPANPRGYVRMYFDRRDPWEAFEAKPGEEAQARQGNGHVR